MDAVLTPVTRARAFHRHELRSLTYVVVDNGNGGIIRNLNAHGAGIQAVAELPSGQAVKMRFELQHPRVRVETAGVVIWSKPSGECGIRFADLTPENIRKINEWIFGNLLEMIPRRASKAETIFDTAAPLLPAEEEDGIVVSPALAKVIILEPLQAAPAPPPSPAAAAAEENLKFVDGQYLLDELDAGSTWMSPSFDWLWQPLSERTIARIADGLIIGSAFLLFVLVFLSIVHAAPRWPFNLIAGVATALFVPFLYRWLFRFCHVPSPGLVLAQMVSENEDAKESHDILGLRR